MTHHTRRSSNQRIAIAGPLLIAAVASLVGPQPCHAFPATSPAEKELLIVVPAALKPGVEAYATYKSHQRPTRVVELETALANASGVDDAERLKRYLYDEWRAENVGYVLLVGDADVLPVRYMTLDRADEAAFNYAFYPCDLYYADLARSDGSFDDWNAARDDFHGHYFGEVRGEFNKHDAINFDRVDYHLDIAVGRWPVNSVEAARRVARKSIAFESAALPAKPAAAIFAVGGWVDMRGQMDANVHALSDAWTVSRHYYADPHRDDRTSPPTEANVIAAMNGGARLILHAGHGRDDRWEDSFGVSAIAQLTNVTTPAIVMSAGCSTARFATLPPYESYEDTDGHAHAGTTGGERFHAPPPPPACYQRGDHNRTGLGEQLLVASDAGAAAYIGCNTGSQPWGLTLMEGFAQHLGSDRDTTLGDAWVGAIEHFYASEHVADLRPTDDWTPPAIFFQPMKFMLLGDPSLRVLPRSE